MGGHRQEIEAGTRNVRSAVNPGTMEKHALTSRRASGKGRNGKQEASFGRTKQDGGPCAPPSRLQTTMWAARCIEE